MGWPLGADAAVRILAGLFLAIVLGIGSSAAQEDSPACQFPEPFTLVDGSPIHTLSGDPLSEWGFNSDPFVMLVEGLYRIWFTSADWSDDEPIWTGGAFSMGPAYAESADGLSWDDQWYRTDEPKRQIRLGLVPGEWDAEGIETVTVVQQLEGGYLLYYTGDQPPDGLTYSIGLATSDDGITWERYGDGPVLEPELDWEQPVCTDPPACETHFGGLLEPTVVYQDGMYHLWYAAWGGESSFGYRMGYATSEDGIQWTRYPDPVFAAGEAGSWDSEIVSHFHVVPDPVQGYHLFYFGIAADQSCDNCNMTPGAIGHAYSPDGIQWERNPNNPVVPATVYGGPSAVIEGDQIKLWYFTAESPDAANGFNFQIELAVSDCR